MHRHRKRLGQQPDSIFYPLSPMIEILPGEFVITAEKGPPHTA